MNSQLLLEAVSFAHRAHHGQVRKDGRTPYAAHVSRVSLIVRNVFGHDDPEMLAAALLHDTIEDTTTDYDDLLEHFGANVANWVRALTKDKRLEESERESVYISQFMAAGWQVQVIKLADILDNRLDSKHLEGAKRVKSLARQQQYLDALQASAFEEVQRAVEKFNALLAEV
jgi:guanosine-3',5'-bis(diphosphate) 3'-pyrophosphohydrolase